MVPANVGLPQMYCERVGLEIFDGAPYHSRCSLSTRCSPPTMGSAYSHMAFRFNEASTGSIAAFAEDYRVVPTASGCHLTWVMAV
jgi:hypothetical protein